MNSKQLKRAFRSLPPLEAGGDYWEEKRRELQVAVRDQEPDGFLNWPLIRATMFVGEAPQYGSEFPFLQQKGYWWSNYLVEMGRAENSNLVHQGYHLAKWEEQKGERVSRLTSVVEIGGGYGAMARVFYAAGFSGKYTIYDCPEFSLLQQYYLSQMGCPVHYAHKPPREKIHCDLLVACCSLSEMSRAQQQKYTAKISANHLLVQAKDALWFGEDNTDLFRLWEDLGAKRVPAVYPPESYYLIK